MDLTIRNFSIFLDLSILTLILFTFLFLLAKKGWKYNLWVFLCLASIFLFAFGRITDKPFLDLINTPLINTPVWKLLLPPGFYLYIRQILGLAKTNSKVWIHFIPFFILYVVLYFFPLRPPDMVAYPKPPPLRIGLVHILTQFVVFVGYFWATFRLVKKHQTLYPNFYSHEDIYSTLKWVNWFVMGSFFFFFLALFTHLIRPFGLIPGFIQFFIIDSSIFLASFLFCFFIINQPIILQEDWQNYFMADLDKNLEKDLLKIPTVTEKSGETTVVFKQTELDSIKILEQYMNTQQPFLQPKLKIAEVAEGIGEKPHYLSKLINSYYGYNFFHFVNSYRINYAIQLMESADSEKYTMEGIGQQAGFNSRATFNARFKETKGMSPGDYQKKWIKAKGA